MTKAAHIDDAQARVAETIKARPVVSFMKGSPSCAGHACHAALPVIGLLSARQRTRTDLVAISVKKGDVP